MFDINHLIPNRLIHWQYPDIWFFILSCSALLKTKTATWFHLNSSVKESKKSGERVLIKHWLKLPEVCNQLSITFCHAGWRLVSGSLMAEWMNHKFNNSLSYMERQIKRMNEKDIHFSSFLVIFYTTLQLFEK